MITAIQMNLFEKIGVFNCSLDLLLSYQNSIYFI